MATYTPNDTEDTDPNANVRSQFVNVILIVILLLVAILIARALNDGGTPPDIVPETITDSTFPSGTPEITPGTTENDEANGLICAQVITRAKNDKTGEIKDFPNSCIPEGWTRINPGATP